ncbi:MAG: flagellar biosynthesis protein FlhB [Lachnospiraceae bacterium]|nr:flagellar biosynthesis protein FlhB [Lachnospiraceae bacterium]
MTSEQKICLWENQFGDFPDLSVQCSLATGKRFGLRYDLQLFAKEGEGGEKTEPATPKKLQDARKKGQVAKSMDAVTAMSLLLFFYMLKIMMGYLGNSFGDTFSMFIAKISDNAGGQFTLQLACSMVGQVFARVVIIALPFFATAFAVAFLVNLVQVKWVISFEPLMPKFDKFNPVSGMKRLFSKDKLMELLKSVLKILAIVYVVMNYLKDKWALVMNMYSYSLNQALSLLGDIIINIGIRISALFIMIAVMDYFYQKWKFSEDMKMTKQEVKDEYKQSEGDPKVKSQQRARMQQAARRRMMQDLPNADVVITNPTHLAVAIRYDKQSHEAPIVVAKGADHLAAKIREAAIANDIEIVENKPLARMLYHNVELGAEIPPELYQMVAEILAYVYNLKGKTG